MVDDDESNNVVENEDIVDANGVLSQQLMNMSVVDRNAILEEIHGARCLAVQETPELIRKSLEEFERELSKDQYMHGPSGKRSAYQILSSRQQHTSTTNYAFDDNFRLRFLRCELFVVPKAVRRYCNYLEYAHEFWGEIALQRPIRLTDFSKPELKVFRTGYFQLLPFRDSSGRRVMVILGGMAPHKDMTARNKIFFYLWDVVTRDSIESQQKGFVIIRLHGNISADDSDYSDNAASVDGSPPISFRSVINNLNRGLASIPSRLVACHTRIPDHPGFQLVWKLFVTQVLTKENVATRTRFVACPGGSDLETRYKLKSYGIPTDVFPITDTDSIKCAYHNQWMKTRKLLEELGFDDARKTNDIHYSNGNDQSDVSMLVECPGLNDVVFRKGSRVTSVENPGNRFFRDLIRGFLEDKERVSEQIRQEASSKIDSDPKAGRPKSAAASKTTAKSLLSQSLSTTTSASSIGAKSNTGKAFCDWLVDHIQHERNGRFLEWNTKLNGWVIMTDKVQISRKASITLYNWGKRLSAETAAKKQHQKRSIVSGSNAPIRADAGGVQNQKRPQLGSEDPSGADDYSAFRFIDGRKPPFEQQEPCCIISSPWITPTLSDSKKSPIVGKKRPRNDDPMTRENRPFSLPL